MLKEQESGQRTADVCRKHGISKATFYKYKAKYGGMEVSDARKLKALEDENAKLNKLLAEAMLDNAVLKDVASKKCMVRLVRASSLLGARCAHRSPLHHMASKFDAA